MNELVMVKGNEIFTDSLVIARKNIFLTSKSLATWNFPI